MKKFLMFLCAVMLVFGMAVSASAIPFDVAGAPASSVTFSNISETGWTSISATLAPGLNDQIFSLSDGESKTFDFFTVNINGAFGYGTADVSATLAFDVPPSGVTGTGDGSWAKLIGSIAAGELTWSDMPQTINLAGGNSFDVAYSDLYGFGSLGTVRATITSHAVPEPTTMLLLGLGLLGVAGIRRKFNK